LVSRVLTTASGTCTLVLDGEPTDGGLRVATFERKASSYS